jgi:hypothetical protein
MKISLSEMKKAAVELAVLEVGIDEGRGGKWGEISMGSLHVPEKFGIPCIEYVMKAYRWKDKEKNPTLPDEVPESAPIGVIVAMAGEEWVVIEVVEGERMWLAPASYIDITK